MSGTKRIEAVLLVLRRVHCVGSGVAVSKRQIIIAIVTLLLACSPRPQMTKVLDLLQSYLEQKGHRACRIDGSIPWQVRLPTPASPRSTPWSMSICMHSLGVGLPVMYVQVLGYHLWGNPGSPDLGQMPDLYLAFTFSS